MPTLITVGNQKGGVGKTTTAVTLAHGLAIKGYQVLLIDCDPQGQCATFLGLQQEPGMYDFLVKEQGLAEVARPADSESRQRQGLSIVPGDKRTGAAAVLLASEHFNVKVLSERLAGVTNYHYIVFDTAPSVASFQEAAIHASDWLIIPVATDYPSTEGMIGILDTMNVVNKRHEGRCQLLGILPTMFDSVTNESKATIEQLRERFAGKLLPPIHRATILREAAAVGESIWEISPKSRAAEEYSELIFRVIDSG